MKHYDQPHKPEAKRKAQAARALWHSFQPLHRNHQGNPLSGLNRSQRATLRGSIALMMSNPDRASSATLDTSLFGVTMADIGALTKAQGPRHQRGKSRR